MSDLIFAALVTRRGSLHVCFSAALGFCTERHANTRKAPQQERIRRPSSKGHHCMEEPPTPDSDPSTKMLVSPVALVAVVVVVSVVVGDGVGGFVLPPIMATPRSTSCTGPPSVAIVHT